MGVFGGYSGNMRIPEEKKEIFVKHMIRLLNYGGMMDFEVIKIYGHEIGLLKPVEIFPGGTVRFYYNYFEDDSWETAGFDGDNCKLWSNKIGSAEFNNVIMAGYMLYEAYDEETGMAEMDGDIIEVTGYMGWINHILGTSFSMKNRFKLWENAEKCAFNRIELKYEEAFPESVFFRIIPRGLEYVAGGTEFADIMYIINGTSCLLDEETEIKEGTYPADILKCRKAIENYFKNNVDDSKELLWELLKKDYFLREKEKDNRLKEIAKLSLVIPARVFVYLAAEVNGDMEFWKTWKELKGFVYRDEHMKKYASDEIINWRKTEQEKPIIPIATSDFLRQDGCFTFYNTPEEIKNKPNYYISDDDRLYWWDGSEEVKISADTDQWLKELARQHKELETSEDCENVGKDFQKFFLITIAEIDKYYKRILPFQTMFYEFLQNGNKKEYIAAIVLLKKLADSEEYRKSGKIIEYVKQWGITSRNVTNNYARIQLKRYLGVMANKKLREKYFGF